MSINLRDFKKVAKYAGFSGETNYANKAWF